MAVASPAAATDVTHFHAGTREVVMTPPIIVGIDPLRHDPDAPVLAALLARATGAPVLAVAAYETLHRLGSADEYELGAPPWRAVCHRGGVPWSRARDRRHLRVVCCARAP